MRVGRVGETPTRLEEGGGRLACEACMTWRCVCLGVEKEMPQAFHGSYE